MKEKTYGQTELIERSVDKQRKNELISGQRSRYNMDERIVRVH